MDRDEILGLLRERIVGFAASRIGADSAQDLAQEILMLLHDKYPHVIAFEELVPLSMQIMRFKIAALRRKGIRRGEAGQIPVDEIPLPDPRESVTSYMERRELLERLQSAIDKLGERCREIMRLKLLGRTFAEIQRELGAESINTVYTWDARCRKQLLDLMGGGWGRP